MKKISVIILATLFIFMMSCNNDEKAAKEAAENIVEGLFENATGSDVDIDINEDGENVEMTIGGEDGIEISINDTGTDVPENFPDDVYLIDGEIESAISMNAGKSDIVTVVVFSEDDYKDIVSKITKEMGSNGWTSGMNMNIGKEAMRMYTKGDNSVTITINGKEKKVEITYIVTVAKK